MTRRCRGVASERHLYVYVSGKVIVELTVSVSRIRKDKVTSC